MEELFALAIELGKGTPSEESKPEGTSPVVPAVDATVVNEPWVRRAKLIRPRGRVGKGHRKKRRGRVAGARNNNQVPVVRENK